MKKIKPIELYYWPTPNGWKVSIMLEECKIPYVIKPVNIGKGEQFKPKFLKISPNNRMPAIIDPSGPGGKDVFEIMIESGDNPVSIVDSNDMRQVSDEGELESIIEKIIQSNPDQVKSLEEKPNLMGWFVGQVMKETQGKANPKSVNELLNKKLLK